MRHGTLAIPLLVALLGPARALAAPPQTDPRAADSLYQRGKAALAAGDLETACARFAESQRLDPAPGTLLNLGECETQQGKVASALAHIEEARRLLPPADFRVPFAEEKIAALAQRVPLVTLVLVTPTGGVSIERDGVSVTGSLGKALPMDPGARELVVRAPGHADARVVITLKERERRTVELSCGPLLPEPTVRRTSVDRPASRSVAGPSPSDRGNVQRAAGLASGAIGVGGLAIGTVLGILAKVTDDAALSHCPNGPSGCTPQGVSGGQSAQNQASLSDVAFIAGGLLLAGGAVVYLTAPHVGTVSIAPVMGSRAAGASLGWAW